MQKKNTKKTSKRTTNQIPAKLRARALAIINSDRYDGDTRASIKFQLSTKDADLAEMVKRVEQGETILDTIMVQADCRNAARKVIALFEVKGVPDFVTDAVMDALKHAAAIKRLHIWKQKGDEEVFDSAALSNLFAITPMLSLDPSEKQRVTDATAEILRNPQTPSDLFCAVAEFVTEAMNKENQKDGEPGQPELLHTASILTVLLDSYPEDELRGAVLTARKEGQS